jgi:hypothetical protein
MQIPKKLEEILASAFMAGAYAESEINQPNFEQWLKLNEANILALGKPEPLAKKKQFEKSCNSCRYNETLKYCHTCDDELSHWKAQL